MRPEGPPRIRADAASVRLRPLEDLALLIQRALLIANPASRRGDRLWRKALEAFTEAGVACDVRLTERSGHAAELANAAVGDSYDAVFVLGGDGTAMEVIGALANTGQPVGILPGGTGNLIARSLGVPRRIAPAVRAVLDGTRARIDLGVIDGARRFAFAAGLGIDARMVEDTPRVLKRRLGVLAYVISATKATFRRELFPVHIDIDGEICERDASVVFITNFGAVLGDLFGLGPGIAHDDGRLDLCVFTARTIPDAVRIAWRLLRRDFRTDELCLYRSGTRFVISTTPPRRYQADGELLGMTPFEVRVEPLAATLMLPETRALRRVARTREAQETLAGSST